MSQPWMEKSLQTYTMRTPLRLQASNARLKERRECSSFSFSLFSSFSSLPFSPPSLPPSSLSSTIHHNHTHNPTLLPHGRIPYGGISHGLSSNGRRQHLHDGFYRVTLRLHTHSTPPCTAAATDSESVSPSTRCQSSSAPQASDAPSSAPECCESPRRLA